MPEYLNLCTYNMVKFISGVEGCDSKMNEILEFEYIIQFILNHKCS